jgi:hypothetical protein
MRIIFNRSGGLMGLKSSITIDLDDLPPDQAGTLSSLVDKAHFFSLTENPPIPPNPDGFQYTITVEAGTNKRTIHTTDTSAPEELRPLLQELSQMARSQRKP